MHIGGKSLATNLPIGGKSLAEWFLTRARCALIRVNAPVRLLNGSLAFPTCTKHDGVVRGQLNTKLYDLFPRWIFLVFTISKGHQILKLKINMNITSDEKSHSQISIPYLETSHVTC